MIFDECKSHCNIKIWKDIDNVCVHFVSFFCHILVSISNALQLLEYFAMNSFLLLSMSNRKIIQQTIASTITLHLYVASIIGMKTNVHFYLTLLLLKVFDVAIVHYVVTFINVVHLHTSPKFMVKGWQGELALIGTMHLDTMSFRFVIKERPLTSLF